MIFSNRYFFWGAWIFLITLLSGINNYYFYSHVERTAERDAKQIKAVIEVEKKCNLSKKLCENHIIEVSKVFAEEASENYNRSFKILGSDKQLIWKCIPKKQYRDTVAGTDITLILSKQFPPKLQYSTYLDTQAFLFSIFKSMTFSITDIASITYSDGFKKALEHEKTFWKRSRPAIGFAIFSFLILWVYRKRENHLIRRQEEKEQEMIAKFKDESEKISTDVNETELYSKFTLYDYILNPPINTLTFKDLILMDTNGIGNKFRKVIEKIFFPIVVKNLNTNPRDLKEAIYLLYDNKMISSKAQIYATLIRLYGNMDSHYNENSEITKEEIHVLAFRLISIVEEVIENNLFDPTIELTKSTPNKKKKFDKESQKWVEA
jgi:hypothetical protein